MKKVFLMTILLLVINYIFFIDGCKSDIRDLQSGIKEAKILVKDERLKDSGVEETKLSGIQVIENIEKKIEKNHLSSVNKTYGRIQDHQGYKLHELTFVLEGQSENLKSFITDEMFGKTYFLQEINMYEEDNRNMMKVSIFVRTL